MSFESLLYLARSMLIPGLLGLLAAAAVYAIFALLTRKKFPANAGTHILRFLFLAYVACVAFLTLAPSGFDAQGGVNLVPFSSVEFAVLSGSEIARQLIVLNIVMFIPMGVFLPWVFPQKAGRLYQTALFSFLATLLIECLQVILPGGRAFDIDDILMNTFGGCIGFSLFALVSAAVKRSKPRRSQTIAWIAVLAALPAVAAGVAVFDGGPKEFNYDFSFSLVPEQMEFAGQADYPRTAMTYRLKETDPGEMLAALVESFGVTGEMEEDDYYLAARQGDVYLSVQKDRGSRSVMLRQPNDEPPQEPDGALAAEAKEFLEKHGMWRDGLVLEEVRESLIEENGTERPNGKDVSFVPEENSPLFVGTARVSFDSEGICDAYYDVMEYEPYREAELMPPEEAFAEMEKTHKCYVWYDYESADPDEVFFDPDRAVLETAALVYRQGSHMKQNLPAWQFPAVFYDGERQCEGYIAAAAIR